MKTCALALLLALCSCFSGLLANAAGDPPTFDIESHCQNVATFCGRFSCTLQECCLQNEKGAYDYLTGVWDTAPADIRKRCLQRAHFGGQSSYALLKDCMRREMEFIRVRQSFKH